MQQSDVSQAPTGRSRTVIDARSDWLHFDLYELWQYRYLIGLFVYRDFVVHYKQTILGPIWWLFQPLLTTGMFTVVFSLIANISTDAIPAPLFYLAGIIVWNFFSQSLLHCSNAFLDNRLVFRKVYFPRMVIPISATLSNLMRFALQFSLFAFFYALYFFGGAAIRPNGLILLFPLLILYVAAIAFGLGILIAALTTKYRDIEFVVPFLTQLGMFASAVVYPLSQVSPKWQYWLSLNPLVPAIELFRLMFLGAGTVIPAAALLGLLTTGTILFFGVLLFNRAGRTFVDTI